MPWAWNPPPVTAAPAAAQRPDTPGLAWQENPHGAGLVTPKTNVTRKDFAAALDTQISLFGALRSWRETLRGQGTFARRNYQAASVNGQKLNLSIGKQELPSVLRSWSGPGHTSGTEARFGGLALGTTYQPDELKNVLASYDKATDEAALTASDGSRLTWLTADALKTKTSALQFSLARARRDILPGDGEQFVEGTALGASGHMNLPLQWKLRANWTRSELTSAAEEEAQGEAWGVAADGPIVHPWGQAKATASFSTTDKDFGTLAAPTPGVGARTGSVALQQDVALGMVKGSMKLKAARSKRPGMGEAAMGEQVADENVEGGANFRVQLMPRLSLVGSGVVRTGAQNFVAQPVELTPPPAASPQPVAVLTDPPARPPVETPATAPATPPTTETEPGIPGGGPEDTVVTPPVPAPVIEIPTPEAQPVEPVSLVPVPVPVPVVPSMPATLPPTPTPETPVTTLPLTPAAGGEAPLPATEGPVTEGPATLGTTPTEATDASAAPGQDVFGREGVALRSDVTQAAGGDVGLELKLSRSLAFTLSTGYTRTLNTRYLFDDWEPLALTDENRFALELRQKTGQGSWGVRVSHKLWNDKYDSVASTLADQQATVLRLETERRLIGAIKVSGGVDWAQHNAYGAQLTARRVQAKLHLAALGRLDMRLTDGPLSSFNLLPNPSLDTTREMSFAWNTGSAAGGNGFGMALEYARRELNNTPDTHNWRLGITYR